MRGRTWRNWSKKSENTPLSPSRVTPSPRPPSDSGIHLVPRPQTSIPSLGPNPPPSSQSLLSHIQEPPPSDSNHLPSDPHTSCFTLSSGSHTPKPLPSNYLPHPSLKSQLHSPKSLPTDPSNPHLHPQSPFHQTQLPWTSQLQCHKHPSLQPGREVLYLFPSFFSLFFLLASLSSPPFWTPWSPEPRR